MQRRGAASLRSECCCRMLLVRAVGGAGILSLPWLSAGGAGAHEGVCVSKWQRASPSCSVCPSADGHLGGRSHSADVPGCRPARWQSRVQVPTFGSTRRSNTHTRHSSTRCHDTLRSALHLRQTEMTRVSLSPRTHIIVDVENSCHSFVEGMRSFTNDVLVLLVIRRRMRQLSTLGCSLVVRRSSRHLPPRRRSVRHSTPQIVPRRTHQRQTGCG